MCELSFTEYPHTPIYIFIYATALCTFCLNILAVSLKVFFTWKHLIYFHSAFRDGVQQLSTPSPWQPLNYPAVLSVFPATWLMSPCGLFLLSANLRQIYVWLSKSVFDMPNFEPNLEPVLESNSSRSRVCPRLASSVTCIWCVPYPHTSLMFVNKLIPYALCFVLEVAADCRGLRIQHRNDVLWP